MPYRSKYLSHSLLPECKTFHQDFTGLILYTSPFHSLMCCGVVPSLTGLHSLNPLVGDQPQPIALGQQERGQEGKDKATMLWLHKVTNAGQGHQPCNRQALQQDCTELPIRHPHILCTTVPKKCIAMMRTCDKRIVERSHLLLRTSNAACIFIYTPIVLGRQLFFVNL